MEPGLLDGQDGRHPALLTATRTRLSAGLFPGHAPLADPPLVYTRARAGVSVAASGPAPWPDLP